VVQGEERAGKIGLTNARAREGHNTNRDGARQRPKPNYGTDPCKLNEKICITDLAE